MVTVTHLDRDPSIDGPEFRPRPADMRLKPQGPPKNLAARIVRGLSTRFWRRFDRSLYLLIRRGLDSLSTPRSAALVSSLRPVTRLDLEDAVVLMTVRSQLHLDRALACYKEPETVRWIRQHLREGDVFFDVGANVGAYSLVAARLAVGEITVHSFEPSFSTYFDLCQNILLNHCQSSVYPHLMALGRFTGLSVFNYSSLDSGAAVHSLGGHFDQTGQEFEPAYSQPVVSFSIDDLVGKLRFAHPNLLKIDVDGTEGDIVSGAEATLGHPDLRSVLIEFYEPDQRHRQVIAVLESLGLDVNERVPHPNGVANYIFIRRAAGGPP